MSETTSGGGGMGCLTVMFLEGEALIAALDLR